MQPSRFNVLPSPFNSGSEFEGIEDETKHNFSSIKKKTLSDECDFSSRFFLACADRIIIDTRQSPERAIITYTVD